MYLNYPLCTLAFSLCASAARVTWDKKYNDANGALTSVMCSDGQNGMITKYKWSTFSQVPSFPYIGGGSIVDAWNSSKCGSCFTLSYAGRSVPLLVLDTTPTGFNIAEQAFNTLTDGQTKLGIIDVTAVQEDVSRCGIRSTSSASSPNSGTSGGSGSSSNSGRPGSSGSSGNSGRPGGSGSGTSGSSGTTGSGTSSSSGSSGPSNSNPGGTWSGGVGR